MMAGAGTYSTRLEWSAAPLGAPDSFGERQRVPAVNGLLWGAIDNQSSGEEVVNGTLRNVLRATVRIRNAVAVKPRELLRDVEWDETWTVESVYRGDNETVCDVYRRT